MGLNEYIIRKIPELMGKHDSKRLLKYKVEVEGVKEFCDIPYMEGGHKQHLLDVYYPEGTTSPLPIIIDIHGGAWVYGYKEINKPFCLTLAKAGFVVVNINYRLLPEVSFPENLRDIFAAFNWVEANAKEFYGDLNNVFLVGDSAGGHLAATATAAVVDSEFAKKCGVRSSLKFKALGMICPATDIEKFTKRDRIPILKYFHKIFLGEDYRNSVYLKHLTVRNNMMEKFPPVFIISNEGDFLKRQVIDFAKECEKRGVKYEFHYTRKKGSTTKLEHVSNVLYPTYPESIAANDAMLEFFLKHAAK